jgi:mycothiol S-conjugate amidase
MSSVMRATPQVILAIFAHPDDEIGIGSTLAYYHEQGVISYLTCATRGEAATIFCDGCATPENLAEVRTHELECACRNIGIGELTWLDWPDGGVPKMPHYRALGQIVAVIRRIRPDIIITHPENGLYPHPDHLAIWSLVREAFDAAADPDAYRQAGQPWAAARLFTRAIPESMFKAAPDFANYRVELNGAQLPFMGTPDAEIDVVMSVGEYAPRRMAAWDCHRSQQNPAGAFSLMPDGMRREWAEIEHYVLAAERVPMPEGASGDLLAGLEEWPASEDPIATMLGVSRSMLRVYAEYTRDVAEERFKSLLSAMADAERDLVYTFAAGMRRQDSVPAQVQILERFVWQANACLTTRSRAAFLQGNIRHTRKLIEREVLEGPELLRTTWEDARAIVQAEAELIEAYAATV